MSGRACGSAEVQGRLAARRVVSGGSDTFRAGSANRGADGLVGVVQSALVLLVAIPALAGTASIGTAGLLDALKKADGSWALATGADAARLFDVRLVGLNRRPVV